MSSNQEGGLVCSNEKCRSRNLISDGNIITCEVCGRVVEENNIVSDVTFVEGANGTSSVVGQFVSATGSSKVYKKTSSGFSRESKEATIETGRRRIAYIAALLKLNSHHVEAAQRLFLLAVQHNFIQGRRTQNVIAACLYIVCRREKTPHLLIDFSDVLQTNVYVLGHTFLKFCRLLNIQIPIIDPSLYIPRFAAKLEFEEKTNAVANTALKLVQRMKRDWIQTGRRPSGICGASLLIAARMHGFRRTQKEIIQVVKVCEMTLRHRLQEFGKTPSGELTAQEFETIDLEGECDPPAFTNALIQKAAQESREEIEHLSTTIEGELQVKPTSEKEKNVVKETTNESISLETSEDLSDLDDEETKIYINTEEEIKAKEQAWDQLHQDYVKLQAQKQNEPKPEKKRKRSKKENTAETAVEAAAEMLKKKFSTRINYAALEELFSVDQKMFDPKTTKVNKLEEEI